jgi:hypothetical protein
MARRAKTGSSSRIAFVTISQYEDQFFTEIGQNRAQGPQTPLRRYRNVQPQLFVCNDN